MVLVIYSHLVILNINFLVCDSDKQDIVKEHIMKLMPNSKILDSRGGCIILNLPFDKIKEMKYFINILNHNYQIQELRPLQNLIKECGMNYTTLEEIFLKVN